MGFFGKLAKGAFDAVSNTVERNGGISGCMSKFADAARKEQIRQMERDSRRICDRLDRDIRAVDRAMKDIDKF